MVFVEELADDEDFAVPAATPAEKPEAKAPSLKKGFLEEKGIEPLYPPEGSSEGKVSPDTHKAHSEHHMNEKLNQDMNHGAKDNNGIDRPAWYTKEWPKDCQYNSPGYHLDELEHSTHQSAVHKEMARGSRWEEALAPGMKRMSFAFNQITDEDLAEIAEKLKGNTDVVELDLSHNHIKDAGVQKLVGVLSGGAAPNLKELRIHSNEFTNLGKVMLTQGLRVFRKKLEIQVDEPSWMKEARDKAEEKKAAEAAPDAAPEEAAAVAANELD